MTYEEALNEINQECVICLTSNRCVKDECIWFLCKKAIEKQIPKKPHVIRAKVIHADSETKWEYIECSYCPSCGTRLTICQDCPNFECRQAIDWSMEE